MGRLATIGVCLVVVIMAAPAPATLPPSLTPDLYLDYGVVNINNPIPDNSTTGLEDWFGVLGVGQIVDLNVSLDINHSWVGDLKVVLKHDDTGTTVTLIDRPGVPATTYGCSGDNISATLDDAAASAVETQCSGVPAISGTFYPNELLAAFNGESLTGTWRLTITDNASGDTGSLIDWTLHFGVMTCDGKVATMVGTPGDDVIFGGPADDVIVGLAGADTIDGGDGDDTICAGAGADTVNGGIGADFIIGGGGPDTIDGGPGADTISGAKGKDVIRGGPGTDDLSGGAGKDTVDYSAASAAVTVDLSMYAASGGDGHDSIHGIENVTGSAYADTITGDGGRNVLRGGPDDDTINGGGGKDRLYGEAGADTLHGNGGNDEIHGGPGYDTASGDAGTDSCDAEVKTTCEM